METVKKKRDMDYCSYDLGGFVGTLPEHAARQGLSASTVRSRKRRGWKLSEALGYVKRIGPKNPSILVAPRRLAIEMKYEKLFDDVLRDMKSEGLSINATAVRIGYEPRALYRYLVKLGDANPWKDLMYSPVAARFKKAHGISIAEWLDLHAAKYSLTQAASFLGYSSITTMRSYLIVNGLKPEFRKQGKHAEHRGQIRNLSDHAAAAGIPAGTISSRIHRGMTLHQALTTPVANPRRKAK